LRLAEGESIFFEKRRLLAEALSCAAFTP